MDASPPDRQLPQAALLWIHAAGERVSTLACAARPPYSRQHAYKIVAGLVPPTARFWEAWDRLAIENRARGAVARYFAEHRGDPDATADRIVAELLREADPSAAVEEHVKFRAEARHER